MEVVEARKDQTYEVLIEQCRDIFQITTDVKVPARLRLYDVSMRVRLAPVETSLEDLLITIPVMKNYMCFDLETGPDLEEYRSEWLYLRVCVWEADYEYDFTK